MPAAAPVFVGTMGTIIAQPDSLRHSITLYNNGANIVYLDYKSNVTIGNGFPLAIGGVAFFTFQSDGPAMRGYIYGISAALCELRVMEG